ncbi:MAG: hypothetical protein A2Z32_12770 [Chloroflexi bacterium RBG_16_69_14]|nr:MAG: hypothetical protein A2Z32_12770 [Chloroflexi bacterium RBG_16_69_14]
MGSVPFGWDSTARPRPSVLVGGSDADRPTPTRDLIRGGGPDFRPIASAGLKSLVLIAMALLLILVLLPAAFVAART